MSDFMKIYLCAAMILIFCFIGCSPKEPQLGEQYIVVKTSWHVSRDSRNPPHVIVEGLLFQRDVDPFESPLPKFQIIEEGNIIEIIERKKSTGEFYNVRIIAQPRLQTELEYIKAEHEKDVAGIRSDESLTPEEKSENIRLEEILFKPRVYAINAQIKTGEIYSISKSALQQSCKLLKK